MATVTFRVVPQKNRTYHVELVRPDGSRRAITGFRSEHEAQAWDIQAGRMIDAVWQLQEGLQPSPLAPPVELMPSPLSARRSIAKLTLPFLSHRSEIFNSAPPLRPAARRGTKHTETEQARPGGKAANGEERKTS